MPKERIYRKGGRPFATWEGVCGMKKWQSGKRPDIAPRHLGGEGKGGSDALKKIPLTVQGKSRGLRRAEILGGRGGESGRGRISRRPSNGKREPARKGSSKKAAHVFGGG